MKSAAATAYTKSTIATVAGSTWAETLTERAALMASIRAAGGRCKVAKNSAGESGKVTYYMGADWMPTSLPKGFIAWVRVES